jgi:outer membrane protein assembly factor BamB
MLTAINLNTGKEIYDVRLGNGKNKTLGSPIIVRGKLLFLMDDGETVVVDPGLDFKVLYRNVLGNGTALDFGASPTVSDGRLFVRSQKFLYCVGEK